MSPPGLRRGTFIAENQLKINLLQSVKLVLLPVSAVYCALHILRRPLEACVMLVDDLALSGVHE